jgi:hypothetical protein
MSDPQMKYVFGRTRDLQCATTGNVPPSERYYRLPKMSFRERLAYRRQAELIYERMKPQLTGENITFRHVEHRELLKVILPSMQSADLTLDEFAVYILDPIIHALTDGGEAYDAITQDEELEDLRKENKRLRDQLEEHKKQQKKPRQPKAKK